MVFATNANGAEFDALITDESGAFNADWRAVWTVRAQRVPEGWSAEIAIPFRSLRYPSLVTGGLGHQRVADDAAQERGDALDGLVARRTAGSSG